MIVQEPGHHVPIFPVSVFFRKDLPLTLTETELLKRCATPPRVAEAGVELTAVGSLLNRPKIILSGWIGLARFLDDGRRQFVDLDIAGDLTAFSLRSDSRAHASYFCLTPVRYVEVAEIVESVIAQPELHPGLLARLRMSDEKQSERLLDHILRVGRMFAHERTAHLALDLYRRHESVGLCTAQSFAMPLTQDVLGDVLGMSTVHMNRTLQQLRRDGLLTTASGRWKILDMEKIQALASGTRECNNGISGDQIS